MATKVAATTAPEVWKGRVIPKESSSQGPSSPRRPKPRSRATPPTVGGSTMGSSTRERTRALPLNSTRASSQARGTPRTRERPSAHRDTRRESFRASTTPGLPRCSPRSPHGVRTRIPISGISRNATASSAGSARATGGRVRVRSLLTGLPGWGRRGRTGRGGVGRSGRGARGKRMRGPPPDAGARGHAEGAVRPPGPDSPLGHRGGAAPATAAGSPPPGGSSAPRGCSAMPRRRPRPRCSWTASAWRPGRRPRRSARPGSPR